MAECANRHGSEIADVNVFPERIEALISAEKLRGTDFCVGAIGATTRRPTGFIHHDFLMEWDLYMMHKSHPIRKS